MSKNIPVITIDGPSGVGKGTISFLLAKRLNFNLLDSGAIYRVLALSAIKNQIDLADETKLASHANSINLSFKITASNVQIMLNNEDITTQIRTQEIGEAASKVAKFELVRAALLQKQRDFKQLPGLIADGRDMGTAVFSDANVKIFLEASAETRAKRRMIQLQKSAKHGNFDEILSEIIQRDKRDRNRKCSPLIPADDAHIIDTSDLSIDEVLQKALDIIKSKNNLPSLL